MPDLTHLPSFDLNAGDVNLARDDLQPLFDKHRIFTIATRLRPSAIPLFTTNTFLAAKVKSLFADLANDTIPLQRFLMHSLFRPSPAVAESLKSLAFSPEEPYYGLHVRTGYDTHETKDPRFTYINNNLNKTAESLLDCVELLDRNVTRIFLASDSVLFKSAFIKVANHRNFHVRAVQQKATHFGIHPQETNKLGLQEKCTSFLNLFTDITSLARGRAILNTGSGFADLANLLSSTKTFRVVNVSLPIESQCKRLQYT